MTIAALTILGTFLCGLGLLKRRKPSDWMIQPSIVVPFLLWTATFFQVIAYHLAHPPETIYAAALRHAMVPALVYVNLVVLCFWVGYASPIGRVIAKPLLPLDFGLPARQGTLRVLGALLSVFVFVILLIVQGEHALGLGHTSAVQDAEWLHSKSAPLAIFIFMCVPLAAGLIGASWPEKGQRTFLNVGFCLFCLFLASTPYMAKFSRGTGLPALLAVGGFAIRYRRVSMLGLGAAVAWAIVAAHAGIVGRSIYGHYSGVYPFFKALFTLSSSGWGEMFVTASGANDSLTPLCVSIRAVESADIWLLTPSNWLRFQLPVPRFLGLHPEWTTSLTYYVGGRGSGFNYTFGMLGDTCAHLGNKGALLFVPVGIMYRMTTALYFGPARRPDAISAYSALLFSSYVAWMLGLFNNYRSWVVGFMYPLYLLLFVMIVRRLLLPPPPEEAWAAQDPLDEERW